MILQHFRTIYSTTHRTICTTTVQLACGNASGLHREVHCSNLDGDTRFFLISLCPSGQMLRYYIKLGVIPSLCNLYNQYSPSSNFSTLCGLIYRERREIDKNTSTNIYILVCVCVCVYIHTYTYLYIYIHTYIFIYLFIYLYLYVGIQWSVFMSAYIRFFDSLCATLRCP